MARAQPTTAADGRTRTPPARRGRPAPDGRPRPPLDRRRVLARALDIVDADGLKGLSMRRLGAALGVDPMAVYHHVPNKDGLLDGVAELLWEEVAPPAAEDAWLEYLRAFARALRRVFLDHPRAAPLLLQRRATSVAALTVLHDCLQRLRDAGFEAQRAGAVLRGVLSYAAGHGAAELAALGWSEAADGCGTPSRQELLLQLGRSLPQDLPRHLVDTAVTLLADCDADSCFELGLDLLLQGVERVHAREVADG